MAEVDPASQESWEDLLELVRTRCGDRALHQFVVACCRRIWHLLTDPRSRAAVEVAERYFAGLAEIEEVDTAREQAWEAERLANQCDGPSICRGVKAAHASAAVYAVYTEPPEEKGSRFGYAADDAARVLEYAATAVAHASWLADSKLPWERRSVDWDAEYERERDAQRRLFREQFGLLGVELPEPGAAAVRPRD